MKKMLSIAMLVLVSLILVACDDSSPSESTSPPPTPIETPTEPAEALTEDVIAQMAGFWRLDYPNITNAIIMILFEDGRWESPGHLPIDYVSGGSFVIANEESGIYQLRLTVEQSTGPHAEFGQEFDVYFYDASNDLLFTVFGSGEGNRDAGFIREHDVAPVNEALFEAGFALLQHDHFGGLHYSMLYEDIVSYMGPPDWVFEPELWSADGLYHWSVIYDANGYMHISFVNETGQHEGGRVYSILTATYHSDTTARGIRLGSTRADVLEAYADVINEEDSRGNRIVAGSVYGGVFFFMDHNDEVEMIFVGASTQWAMRQSWRP